MRCARPATWNVFYLPRLARGRDLFGQLGLFAGAVMPKPKKPRPIRQPRYKGSQLKVTPEALEASLRAFAVRPRNPQAKAPFRPTVGAPIGCAGAPYTVVTCSMRTDRASYALQALLDPAERVRAGLPTYLNWQLVRDLHSNVAPEDVPLDGICVEDPTGETWCLSGTSMQLWIDVARPAPPGDERTLFDGGGRVAVAAVAAAAAAVAPPATPKPPPKPTGAKPKPKPKPAAKAGYLMTAGDFKRAVERELGKNWKHLAEPFTGAELRAAGRTPEDTARRLREREKGFDHANDDDR